MVRLYTQKLHEKIQQGNAVTRWKKGVTLKLKSIGVTVVLCSCVDTQDGV